MAALLCPAAPVAARDPATEFDAMYDDVAAHVMDPANHPDLAHGIVEIEYGDAKAYFPQWVYTLDEMEGFSATPRQLAIAGEMSKRYEESFDKLEAHPIKSFNEYGLVMDVAIGVEGVLRSCEHEPGTEARDLARRYLDLARPVARHPGLVMGWHMEPYGPATVIAGGAWFYLYYAQIMGPEDPRYEEYKKIGLGMIDKMDKKLYCAREGKYLYSVRPGHDFTYLYCNTVMVQALLRAHAVTGEQRYYDRAREIMAALERDLYHPGYQGFLAAEPDGRCFRKYQKIGPQYNNDYMALSGHNYMIYAYLSMYEASGFEDDELPAKAALCFRFIRDRLWDHEGRIQHHIERGVLSPASEYCTGCNVETLFHIIQYKAMLEKRPVMGFYKEERR